MNYPKLKLNYCEKELKEYFTLSQKEKELLNNIRKERNILGFAILLKTYQYLIFPLIKKEKLYLPDDQIQLSNLQGVIDRSIKWHNINEQYSEMVRYVTAATEKTGPIESILRRFHKNNRNHPTYKAFVEAGKALKTIHICRYVMDENYRREINDALNIIENWNSYRVFISYGKDSELQTNDPEKQELSILCLHFIQNAIILMNTILIEHVILSEGFYKRMQPKDYEALTALLSLNINPYGYINMDFNKPSILNTA